MKEQKEKPKQEIEVVKQEPVKKEEPNIEEALNAIGGYSANLLQTNEGAIVTTATHQISQ